MKYTLLLTFLALTACGVQTDLRQQTANHIARPAFMSERFIHADGFQLKSWERMHQRGDAAMVYIEGDSHAIGAPTPFHPVALELASRDGSKNLAYLGRPCQFIKFPQTKGCENNYWKSELYTEEIIRAYESAINDIVKRYDINGIHLVGHGGGGNLAAILTARNKDVLSLRTVAGNLNPELVDKNRLSADSIYAVDYGTQLATVPQMHFIGGLDTYITPKIYHSYRQSIGLSECINFQIIPDASHTRGWVEKWPRLLTEAVPYCEEIYKEVPLPEPTPMEIPKTLYKDLAK
jgi:hypothetical protein